MKGIKIFEIEKKPRKGLLAIEWIILGYMVLTLLLALFMSTKIHNIDPMIQHRSDDLGTLPHRNDDAGSLGGISADTLPVHDVHAYRPTVTPLGMVVS